MIYYITNPQYSNEYTPYLPIDQKERIKNRKKHERTCAKKRRKRKAKKTGAKKR